MFFPLPQGQVERGHGVSGCPAQQPHPVDGEPGCEERGQDEPLSPGEGWAQTPQAPYSPPEHPAQPDRERGRDSRRERQKDNLCFAKKFLPTTCGTSIYGHLSSQDLSLNVDLSIAS